MFKIDARAKARYGKKDFGALHFAAFKNMEFIEMQRRLLSLDHNTRHSDRRLTTEKKIDVMMKAIALQAGSDMNGSAPQANDRELFDKNQRRTMHINSTIPLGMIRFANKSEQKRYVRVANCILALNDTSMRKG